MVYFCSNNSRLIKILHLVFLPQLGICMNKLSKSSAKTTLCYSSKDYNECKECKENYNDYHKVDVTGWRGERIPGARSNSWSL